MEKPIMKFTVLVSCIAVFLSNVCGDTENDLEYTNEFVYKTAVEFVDECGSKNLTFCVKERILHYIETIPSEIDIGEGLKVKPSNESRRSRYDRTAKNDSEVREEELDKLLTNKLSDYIYTHRLEYKMPPEIVNDLQTAIEEGRKKKGGEGGMGMRQLLLLFKIKAAILGAIALKLITLVAFKALLMAKIALTVATVIILKNLVEPKHSTSSYEVHSVPYYDDHSPFDRISLK